MKRKVLILGLLALLPLVSVCAQNRHVRWSYESEKISENLFKISITANVDAGWHIYDTTRNDLGPLPTSIVLLTESGQAAELEGDMEVSGKLVTYYDRDYRTNVAYYDGTTTFTQKVRTGSSPAVLVAELEWMACNNVSCEPPSSEKLEIRLQ